MLRGFSSLTGVRSGYLGFASSVRIPDRTATDEGRGVAEGEEVVMRRLLLWSALFAFLVAFFWLIEGRHRAYIKRHAGATFEHVSKTVSEDDENAAKQ
jgi:hypothetical protein